MALYSNGGKVFSFPSGATVSITAAQINYWTTATTPYASAGDFNDLPTTAIFKADGTNAAITQTLTQSAVTAVSSNLAEGDGGYPLGSSNFDLSKAAVLAAGDLPLEVTAVNDLATTIDGQTEANAALEISYAGQTMSSTAGADGNFSALLTTKPTVGETIAVGANKHFLTTRKSLTVTGSVSITDLPDIPFNAIGTPRYTAPLDRIIPDLKIELTDTRTSGGHWALYVATESELQSDGNVISGAVTFTNAETAVIGADYMLVAEGQTDRAQKIYLSWEQTKGVLLDISESAVHVGGKYVAKLKWTVEFD